MTKRLWSTKSRSLASACADAPAALPHQALLKLLCEVCHQRNSHSLWTFCFFCRDPITKSTPTWEYDQAELKKLLSKMGLVSLPHACSG